MDELERATLEWANAIEAGDFAKASALMNSMWILFQVAIVPQIASDLKELTFLKTPIYTQDGGSYILQLIHIDGPKIKINETGAMTIGTKQDIK